MHDLRLNSLLILTTLEPAVIDLSFLNELGADKVKEYTGVEIAREITNQINREYGDQRFFDFSTLKETETSTTADLFKFIANQEDQTPTEDDEIIVTLTEKRTGDDPAKGYFWRFQRSHPG